VSGSFGRTVLGLFLVLQGGLLLIASGRARTVDEHSLHFMAESLNERGSLAVPQLVAIRSFYGKLSVRGVPYAPYSPGQPMAAALYLRVLGPIFRAAAPRASGESALLAHEAATGLLNTTLTALGAVLFLCAVRGLGVSIRRAVWSSALLIFSTPLIVYSKYSFSEPFLAALVAGMILGLILHDRGHPVGPWVAGFAVAGAIAVKFAVGGLLAAAAGLALVSRPEGRRPAALIRFGLVPLCVLAAHLAWNATRFGSLWDLGYPEAAELGRRLNDFDTPLVTGLFGLLLSPGKGLVLFAPAVCTALFGWRAVHRRTPTTSIAVLAFFSGSLLLYARYSAWEGGYCFGPRYLLPALPGLFLGLPFMLASRRRRVALLLCAFGALMQVPGVATSFAEDQMAGGRYYDAAYRYDLDYTPLGQWALALRYAPGLANGSAWSEPLGLGLDFWFVFLVRAGFSRALMAVWFLCVAALLAMGVWLLRKRPEDPSRPDSGQVTSGR